MNQKRDSLTQLVSRWMADGTEMISEHTSITQPQPIVDDLREIGAQLDRIGDHLATQNLIAAAAAGLLDHPVIGPRVRAELTGTEREAMG